VTLIASIRRLSLCLAVLLAAAAGSARAADYVPGEVVVGYLLGSTAHARAAIDAGAGGRATAPAGGPRERVVRLAPGVSVRHAIARLRRSPVVAYAVPNYIAHTAGDFIPDDRGRSHVPGGWRSVQWNFLPGTGVDAPPAWGNLIAAGRPGAQGVTIAVLDTGIAYRDWRRYRKSPDFTGTRFVSPYDFVAHNRYPLDREGHGTFVAGTIAEATNNGYALTGLAYGASIMPVRVLGADGTGDAATIARGIRYAVSHGARVINLSLEFSLDVSGSEIPDIIAALRFAHDRGVVLVGASGNEGVAQLAYPARASPVISVGATTRDRCLADYSNGGRGLDVVAPGGGDDSTVIADPNCHPDRQGPPIYQLTLLRPGDPRHFGIPGDVFGTSMAAPHVAAVAAMVIASGVLGPNPTPDQVRLRLKVTAQHLGSKWPNRDYGYGLVDAGAATAPTPGPVPQ
jgi:serine protease